MENQEKPKKNNFFLIIGIVGSIMLIIAITGLVMDCINKSDYIEIKNDLLIKKQQEESICSYKKDSLSKELSRLAIYKTLTATMVYRDEVLMGLKHRVGDIVYLKRDSSKAVVSDIVIGGSKYEYYIHYRVISKDNSWEELIPELLY